ncbi:MAG TPA: hypothetical protein VJL08_03485 [Dehalococcoidia bacterium]|nr:hypothetical protein [Dehalococcoidia bacterium]
MRYAHKDVNGNEGLKQLAELEERKRCAVAYAQGLGLTSDEIAQARLWMEDWQRLVLKSHIFQIRLTEADFKSYILKRLTDETRANQARGGAP